MTVEVINNWPLMVITTPSDMSLLKESTPHFPNKNGQRIETLDQRRTLAPDIYLEKGRFVDIYI